jgi:hypothetical protein
MAMLTELMGFIDVCDLIWIYLFSSSSRLNLLFMESICIAFGHLVVYIGRRYSHRTGYDLCMDFRFWTMYIHHYSVLVCSKHLWNSE